MPDVHSYPGLAALRATTRGAASVRVAVIDGPTDRSHPCFAGATLVEVPTPWTSVAQDDENFVAHGTGIGSMLFGQVGTSVEGIAPDVTGILVPAATQPEDVAELTLVRALDAALDAEADIIHCALCLPRGIPRATVSAHLRRTLSTIEERGVLLIAPSGNESGASTCAPADQPQVLAVGALDEDGTVRSSSNHGAAFSGHGLMAIGAGVLVADPDGGTATRNGTSVAAPWVTGTAALLMSVARAHGQRLSARDCIQLLLASARPVDDERAIGGALAPDRALEALLDRLGGSEVARPQLHVADASSASADGFTSVAHAPVLRRPRSPLVHPIGQLTCEPVDEAAHERLAIVMQRAGIDESPDSDRALLAHLRAIPHDSDLVRFVLRIGGQPRYDLVAAGPHAAAVVDRLIALASASIGIEAVPRLVDRIAVPGLLLPSLVRLRDGTRVRQVRVSIAETLSGWRTDDIAEAALARLGPVTPPARQLLIGLLERVYEQQHNDGSAAPDRALNASVTNATQFAYVANEMSAHGAELVELSVRPSRYDRPRSDCWDVVLTFADPEEPMRSWWQWVWTVDVSDVRPVSTNWPRAWRVEPYPILEEVDA